MKLVTAYAVVVTFLCGYALIAADQQKRRADALERQLAAKPTATIATAAPATKSRTFTSSNGYVLTAADLDRIDADHTAEKAAAEVEYYMRKHPLLRK